MFSKIHSGALYGLETLPVVVETDVHPHGLPAITIVGLGDKAVAEAKERVLAALHNSNLPVPEHRTTINLSPADVPKEGTLYDLPIAVGILASGGYITSENLADYFFMGELSLNGHLTRIRGALPLTLLAAKKGYRAVFAPFENYKELSSIANISIFPVKKLTDVVTHLNGQKKLTQLIPQPVSHYLEHVSYEYDFCDIIEQAEAKRVAEIAAAGFHNMLLNGPPGTGKTLLARAMPSIVPPLSHEEIMETTRIFSVSGLLSEQQPLVLYPPFRSPHHTISRVGLIGGGSKPMPGEISLSHRGILFLDELAEFPRSVLEALRQPLEDGHVTISRAQGNARFPTRFMFIAATNPCPCGNLGNPKKRCICSVSQIVNYKKRLSGPLLDRIDLHVFVPFIDAHKLTLKAEKPVETSETVRARVITARERQAHRLKERTIKTNGEMSTKDVKELCNMTQQAETVLKKAIDTLNLSVRTYFKAIKVATTIADLAGVHTIDTVHIAEALQYRPAE